MPLKFAQKWRLNLAENWGTDNSLIGTITRNKNQNVLINVIGELKHRVKNVPELIEGEAVIIADKCIKMSCRI